MCMKRSSFLEAEGSKSGSPVARRVTKSRLCGFGFFSLVLLFICFQLGVNRYGFIDTVKGGGGWNDFESRKTKNKYVIKQVV